MKKCTRCGESKPLDQFHKNKRGRGGLRAQCKTCRAAYNCKWHADNSERVRETSRKWYAVNADRVLDYGRKWRKENPEAAQLIKRRHRALRLDNGVFEITPKELKRLLAEPCYLCGVAPSTDFEHIIPESKGGRWSIGNILGACGPCNGSKHDKFLFEFKVRRRVLP